MFPRRSGTGQWKSVWRRRWCFVRRIAAWLSCSRCCQQSGKRWKIICKIELAQKSMKIGSNIQDFEPICCCFWADLTFRCLNLSFYCKAQQEGSTHGCSLLEIICEWSFTLQSSQPSARRQAILLMRTDWHVFWTNLNSLIQSAKGEWCWA